MRELLIAELVKEVLGPRNGPAETIADDPLSEYITGVLAPRSKAPARNIEADAAVVGEDGPASEDEGSEPDIQPVVSAPVLDPKARPHSFGITFFLKSKSSVPSFDICVSWGSYQEGEAGWKRASHHCLLSLDQSGVS